jgi:hypothetical protein
MTGGSHGAFTIYDHAYPCKVPDSSTPARAAGVNLESRIRSNGDETGAFIAPQGTVVIEKTGLPDQVRFSGAELNGTDRTLFTHNHPGNGSFSRQDIVAAILSDLEELRAVGPTIRHMLRAPSGWPTAAALDAAIARATPVATRRVAQMLASGALNGPFLQPELTHQLWVAVAKDLRLDYIRERS